MTNTVLNCPNLFEYATSELSQDAVICWLLRWADPKCRDTSAALHDAGRALLIHIGQISRDKTLPETVQSVEPVRGRQYMDVVCHINEGQDTHTAILIEDKTDTLERANQMRRYRDRIGNELPEERILPVYLKTGDQSNTSLRDISERGNAILLRKDLLNVLEGRSEALAESDILRDFVSRLRRWEDEVQAWATNRPEMWGWHAWQGFYAALEEYIEGGDWSYVPNQSRGFLGFYVGFFCRDEITAYIQIEGGDSTDESGVRAGKLMFRINCERARRERYRDLRAHWHREVMDRKGATLAERPARFGFGRTMAVAAVPRKQWQVCGKNGLLNLERTAANVRECLAILEVSRPPAQNSQ